MLLTGAMSEHGSYMKGYSSQPVYVGTAQARWQITLSRTKSSSKARDDSHNAFDVHYCSAISFREQYTFLLVCMHQSIETVFMSYCKATYSYLAIIDQEIIVCM